MTIEASQLLEKDQENHKVEYEELRNSHQRLIDFVATGCDVIWEMDADLRLVNGLEIIRKGGMLDVETPAGNAYMMGKTVVDILGENPVCEPSLQSHLDDLCARRPFRAFVCRLPLADGATLWMESNGNPFFSSEGIFLGYRGTTRDITLRKMHEERITFIAQHDALTSLPNRKLFRERIEQALSKSGTGFAVMCLDLDRFKMVNDTLGHPVGDGLLRAVAERLSSCLREVDTVGRLGGDEFAIIQAGLQEPEQAALLAQRIAEEIGQPYDLEGHHVAIRVTTGIAVAPVDGLDPDQLLKNADIALYRAKLDEPGGYRFFEPEMAARLEVRRTLEMEMRRAVSNGEFELFYQPVLNAQSGQINAFEALLRWQHPSRGMVLPCDFIPIAEETGMIVPIGEWVLRRACAEAARWPGHINLAVNLSPAQFKSRMLVRAVREALAASGLSANRLELEITEAVLMENNDATVAVLHELRSLGSRIAMDDFGTGYSSLSYLRSFPFDKIKIDRSFISDLSQKDGAIAILRAIVGLGGSLHLATTAEGVETQEQFIMLRDEGCTEVQGYLFSRPRPAEDVRALLDKPAFVVADRKSADSVQCAGAYLDEGECRPGGRQQARRPAPLCGTAFSALLQEPSPHEEIKT